MFFSNVKARCLLIFLLVSSSFINSSHAQDANADFANKVDNIGELTPTQSDLLGYLETIYNHMSGANTLNDGQIADQRNGFQDTFPGFGSSVGLVDIAFDVVALYDDTRGAAFTSGSQTDGGISQTPNNNSLDHAVIGIMQGILDFGYNDAQLSQNPSFFDNRKLETSSFFPGAVNVPSSEYTSCDVKVNGTHVAGFGIPAASEDIDARRPTGCYLAPGAVAQVTVPQSLVNVGASILVGGHTWDLSNKDQMLRMNRVTKLYEINDTIVNVGNPLGGGIYINIPFQQDLGIIDIDIDNVVRSPYFANTKANQTSAEQWRSVERNHPAPWMDIETERAMIQLPTSWVNAVDDLTPAADDWDAAIDAVSVFLDRQSRSKTAIFAQVDVILRGSAFFPGYPQSNDEYNPDTNYSGNENHILVRGPRDKTGTTASILFHELGHQEHIYKLQGEVEALVNFPYVAVQNIAFGKDLNQAFSESLFNFDHTIEEAAQSWMIADNFRQGLPMSSTSGQFLQEFAYQPRGYAKYADVVRLFGWETLAGFYNSLNLQYERGESFPFDRNNVPADRMILDLSVASGYDMTPLFRFWGIHSENPEELARDIAANDIKPSAAIFDQLESYKALVPQDNAAFQSFCLNDFSRDSIVNFTNPFPQLPKSYYNGLCGVWWETYNDSLAQQAETQVQNVINQYFPNGRPVDDGPAPIPDPTPDPTPGAESRTLQHVGSSLQLAIGDAISDELRNADLVDFSLVGDAVEWEFTDAGDGYVFIDSIGNNALLREDPTTNVIQIASNVFTDDSVQWTIETTNSDDDQFFIVNRFSGNKLFASGENSDISSAPANGFFGVNARWELVDAPTPVLLEGQAIVHAGNDQNLTVGADIDTSTNDIELAANADSNESRWRLVETDDIDADGNAYYFIQNVDTEMRIQDLNGDTRLVPNSFTEDLVKWRSLRAGSGTVIFENKSTGRRLHAPNEGNGAPGSVPATVRDDSVRWRLN